MTWDSFVNCFLFFFKVFLGVTDNLQVAFVHAYVYSLHQYFSALGRTGIATDFLLPSQRTGNTVVGVVQRGGSREK